MKRLQLSTVDLVGSPTQAQVHAGIEFIQENAKNGHSVYVHCKAGRTRSATLVACYLMKVSPITTYTPSVEPSTFWQRFPYDACVYKVYLLHVCNYFVLHYRFFLICGNLHQSYINRLTNKHIRNCYITIKHLPIYPLPTFNVLSNLPIDLPPPKCDIFYRWSLNSISCFVTLPYLEGSSKRVSWRNI